ncbi:zinc uptake protein ZrgA [Vibrio rarus]|uniref:zinc uptake protein ZrgA n=1 Tax=Vibrio rarus TaxID=413403 RepID=UPI0021C3A206|nr:DUF2796 domain-containing protein [Vibrio rarus]
MIKVMKPLLPLSVLALAVTSLSTHAEEHFRQHAAHVHGSVEFNIAQDGNDLLVEILAPGADVIGFEHIPTNDKQQKVLDTAMTHLNSADSILTLSADAGCTLASKTVTHKLSGDSHEDHEHEHADHKDHHDDHGHNDKHDHDKHEGEHHDHEHGDHHDHADHKDHHDDHGHDDKHDHDKHEGENHDHHDGHGAFNIAYQYQCKDISKLSHIETNWFELFTGTHVVHVNLLTDTAQLASELTKDNSIIKL